MPDFEFTDEELLGYLDEALAIDRMSAIESQLRQSKELRLYLAHLARARDDGVHSVGAIWRRGRLSCASRSDLGGYLLGTLEADAADYLSFHLEVVGCRYCNANLQDIQRASAASESKPQRRQRYFESSAGYLHPGE